MAALPIDVRFTVKANMRPFSKKSGKILLAAESTVRPASLTLEPSDQEYLLAPHCPERANYAP
jgi:hypothetical protein